MKLYIRFGSLAKFQRIFDSNEYLRVILTKIGWDEEEKYLIFKRVK